MRAFWIVASVAVAYVACGPENAMNPSDAPTGTGSNPGGSGGSGTNVVDDVTCATFTSNDTGSGSAANKTQTDYRYAVVASVHPGDSFAIETCDYTVTFTDQNGVTTSGNLNLPNYQPYCAQGHTCTTSGTPYPTVAHGCTWSSVGTFWDNNLYVSCGQTATTYNAQGVMTGKTAYSYASIKIHH